MIPTMILVGLLLGSMPVRWKYHGEAVTVAAVLTSIVWGLIVEVPVGGTLLAMLNVIAGMVPPLLFQWVWSIYARHAAPPAT